MTILESCFGQDVYAKAGVYGTDSIISTQAASETDRRINTFQLRAARPRWSREWFAHQINKRLQTNLPGVHSAIAKHKGDAIAALEIGGDNYSLDYGIPGHFIEMDRYLQSQGIPVVLWGASVGPFENAPQFKQPMLDHLKSLTAIFARESATVEYLSKNGVSENVHHVADPAFLLEPQQPSIERLGGQIPPETIGLNFSPLLVKYFMKERKPPWEITLDDLEPWIKCCTSTVNEIGLRFKRPILLVPHACSSLVGTSDHQLLLEIEKRVTALGKCTVRCLPDVLNARESKWAISQCSVFAGARTHSTIAGMSSATPTISMSYSMKARGINQDVFDSQRYCIDSSKLESVDILADAIAYALENSAAITEQIESRLPEIRASALKAGIILKELLA
jgi:colanic acid/amylovoran biosynthesis protein